MLILSHQSLLFYPRKYGALENPYQVIKEIGLHSFFSFRLIFLSPSIFRYLLLSFDTFHKLRWPAQDFPSERTLFLAVFSVLATTPPPQPPSSQIKIWISWDLFCALRTLLQENLLKLIWETNVNSVNWLMCYHFQEWYLHFNRDWGF